MARQRFRTNIVGSSNWGRAYVAYKTNGEVYTRKPYIKLGGQYKRATQQDIKDFPDFIVWK